MDRRIANGLRRSTPIALVAAACLLVAPGLAAPPPAEAAKSSLDPSVRQAFREPVVLSSKDGVLEVRLTAHQSEARLDTVVEPVRNFLLYAYEVVRGTPSDGQMTSDGTYPAPTLQVYPGDKLIVHLENGLRDLTIRDFYDPAFTPKGGKVPLYPPQLKTAPINLHTHGLRISPKGNSDNVLLHIGAGLANTYEYDIPADHPHGAYWYHPHLHGLTSPQVYFGLVGVLAVGRLDGNVPLVTEKQLPIRNMVLQYNWVFDRGGGLAEIRNPNWTQYVSTLELATDGALAKGTYRPLLTPPNFKDSKKGTDFVSVFWTGPLGVNNNRGRFQFIPRNLRDFRAKPGGPGHDVPVDPSLPEYKRDVQFTINGQFQPVIASRPGQTEIWVLSNLSDMAFMNVQLTETATGRHPKIAILAKDGNPHPAVHYPPTYGGTRLLMAPATRYAIAVTMPESGDLILEMPPIGKGTRTVSNPGILYTNDGTDNPPGTRGVVSVFPQSISHDDGFFVFPTQVLAKAVLRGGKGVTVPFVEGQALNAPDTGFTDLSKVTPDFVRELKVTGGFLNDLASKNDPKAFVYAFNNQGFPNAPLFQPRLGSVEEWRLYNYNNDSHPMHVHVNDFQVFRYFDPTTDLVTGPNIWAEDTTNLPRPTLLVGEDAGIPAELFLRSSFDNYIGLFVMHCHRLNHEDNGLMLLVNVIPEVSTYAVAVPGSPGQPAMVNVYDGKGDRRVATVTPFPAFEGTPSVAMGDVDGDSVLDLIVGAGEGYAPEVVAYSGSGVGGKAAFATELTRFQAFAADAQGGVSVTSAQIDGTTSDNIIVGSGPGVASEVKVFAYEPSSAPGLFSRFSPYPGDRSGVSLASGFVTLTTGRDAIVTAPGPGTTAQVKVFAYPLYRPIGGKDASKASGPGEPVMTAEFTPFGNDYRGGVSVATGWLYGSLGGAKRIVVGQLDGPGEVRIFSTGTALQGGPAMYLEGPVEHGYHAAFAEDLRFKPFGGKSGVRVGTTSTTTGANLLVSGVSPKGGKAEVLKYDVTRPDPDKAELQAVRLGAVASAGASPPALGSN